MSVLNIIVLALLQGLTELLPISSSAHLILVPAITGWPDQGLMVDAALHLGTFAAIALYFWRDVLEMIVGLLNLLRGKVTPGARLAGYVIIATIPAIIAGLSIQHYAETVLRSVAIIAWTATLFGILLYVADRFGVRVKRLEHMTWKGALIVGLAQVLALIPGTSRSGITMTAGRFLGFERRDAARFSFLVSLPVTLGAGLLGVHEILKGADGGAHFHDAALAAGGAFLASLATVAFLMNYLRTASFTPFVIYRVALGLALLVWVYGFGGPHIAP
ncbi:MAG TPA: undecaprenyl-diphosphate phosphatase [Alphaproteobacteria bacterium]